MKKYFIIFIIINFLIRIGVLLNSCFFEGDDGGRYYLEGINLSNHGVFSSEPNEKPGPSAHDLPGYGFLFSIILKTSFGQQNFTYILGIINIIFLGLILVTVYFTTKLLTNNIILGYISIFLILLHPNIFVYEVFHMPDFIFTFLILLTTYFFISWLKTQFSQYLLISFILWGGSVLFKPISIFIGPILFILSIIFHPNKSIFKYLIFLFIGIGVILPWSLRNKKIYDSFSLSTINGTNLFFYNYKFLLEYQELENIDDYLLNKKKELTKGIKNEMAISKSLSIFALKEISKSPVDYFLMSLKRQSKMYLRTSSISFFRIMGNLNSVKNLQKFNLNVGYSSFLKLDFKSKLYLILSISFVLIVYLFLLIGLYILFKKNDISHFVILIILIYFMLIIGPLNSARYTIPLIPLYSIISSLGIQTLLKNEK